MENLKTFEELFNWKKGLAASALGVALLTGISSCGDNVDYQKTIELNINKEDTILNSLLKENNIEIPCVIEISNINCSVCSRYYVNTVKKIAKKYKNINFYYILTGKLIYPEGPDRHNRKKYFYANNKIFDVKEDHGHGYSVKDGKNISTSDNIEKFRKNIMDKYDIYYFPTTILIDENKILHIFRYGYMTEGRLDRYIKKYIMKFNIQ